MKSLLRIQKAVYNEPWMILPSMHEIIRTQLEQHMAGEKAQMPMPDDEMPEDPEDEMPMEEKANVAIINIEGIIGKRLGMLETMCGGCDVDLISEAIDVVMEDPNITDVIFYINSPGGTVCGVPELAQKIAGCGDKKRTWAMVDVLAASAAYYLASQCGTVVCTPSSELGSVGVYSIYLDESVALANAGIKVNAISAGKYKLTGASFKPMTDEERAMLQADVDKIYNAFKAAVTSKRPIDDEDLQGQVFDGETSVTKGFSDGLVNSMSELLAVIAGQQK